MTLPSATDKAVVVEAMFDRIAASYDRMNRVMTFGMDQGWRRRQLDIVGVRAGETLLDVGCGTGDLCELAAARGARAIGVDYSAGMLAMAHRRGINAEFVRVDALELPLPDASADRYVSAFALRNFADLAPAFAEAARVLRPGGRIALLEVATPDNPILRFGHGLWFRFGVPLLGRLLVEREAYSYLPASVVYLPEWPEMRAMLAEVGFEDLRRETRCLGAVQILSGTRAGVGSHA
jgi:demethylmenaquinone methyltransferase/2-methoxy-6-polyprenyl-1,4-benzoquinol methylase